MRLILAATLALLCLSACDQAVTSTSADSERAHPSAFIKVNYEVRRNLLGKKVIEGTVINTGKYLTYKTVTLKIDCYKEGKDNPVTYTIPDAVKPGGTQTFKFKPEGNPETIKVAVISASAD